jgi:hypothetical protein
VQSIGAGVANVHTGAFANVVGVLQYLHALAAVLAAAGQFRLLGVGYFLLGQHNIFFAHRCVLTIIIYSTTPAPPEDRRFTHGDFCLPNVLLVEDGRGGFQVSGFVDCGNAGIADAYQDLALAARSVARNFGEPLVRVLFAKYGLAQPDEPKLAYYQLLDEFF